MEGHVLRDARKCECRCNDVCDECVGEDVNRLVEEFGGIEGDRDREDRVHSVAQGEGHHVVEKHVFVVGVVAGGVWLLLLPGAGCGREKNVVHACIKVELVFEFGLVRVIG